MNLTRRRRRRQKVIGAPPPPTVPGSAALGAAHIPSCQAGH